MSWRDWNDLRQLGLHEAVIPSGAGTQVEILARGDDGRLESLTLDNMAQPVGSWTQVRPESGLYPPVVVAGPAGRLDLFELNDSGWLRHTWRDPADMLWREYNVKGWPGPGDFSTDLPRLSATAHGDGRIEIFGRAALRHSHWLGHTWAHAREGWWTTVHYRPDASLGQPPAAAARRQAGREVLVVAGVTHDQSLVTRHQLHGADDADWSDWAAVPAHELPGAPASAPVLVAPQDQELRLFYIDVLGRVVMGVDVGDQLHPVWSFTTVATQTALSPALTTIAHAAGPGSRLAPNRVNSSAGTSQRDRRARWAATWTRPPASPPPSAASPAPRPSRSWHAVRTAGSRLAESSRAGHSRSRGAGRPR